MNAANAQHGMKILPSLRSSHQAEPNVKYAPAQKCNWRRPRHVTPRARRRLLRQSLSFKSFEHFRTSAYTRHIAGEIRIRLEIYFDEVRPVHDRKGIRIGDGEVV